MEENSLRRRYRSVALIATVATLALAYGAARHLSWASTKPTAQQVFSVTVDRDKAPWERPVIAIREGQPVHIDVHSQEAGVLMAHEIPGALATCASGANQSLDLLPVGITGRFSLHFHSQTGEQIEVAVIEIYPDN
ncbi:hypothetical protein [Burkholderia multivorans]|uniref:hypothetical protein n=1 Tax=Burkholderia multivorans TaxID=87883 RepID=UPI000CFED0B5|nr:hypothetical protein [Burkholderia multivorans]MBR8240775.1 hypothetical protein [Burkholderia multivorans]MDN7944045.1 hypothetical protein [Burkholderia multivorans]MDR9176275.1 hypothetical protein [Burkholderia multivorans]MDR9182991.1 hypothetical protein [Burkholderia multivorans]MDR9188938.1 hypothetical protein [Burkholderia multivorans]